MLDHPTPWLLGVVAAAAAAVGAAIAARVQLLPDVIDISIVRPARAPSDRCSPSTARRFAPDRLGGNTLLGNLVGGVPCRQVCEAPTAARRRHRLT